ncbi:MAG: NUDIX domain-containing protein [Hyphomicrobiales bacterium]
MHDPRQFPRLGASACVWRDGRVLLIERAKPPLGIWSLPGGHVEPGETAAEAARRELAEETGIVAQLETFVGFYEVIRRDAAGSVSLHYAIACYAGLAQSGEARAGSDAAACRWVLPGDVGPLLLALNVRDAIERARAILNL